MFNNPRRRLVGFTCSALLLLSCAVFGLGFSVITRGLNAAAQGAARRIVYGLTFLPSGFDPHINSNSELGIPLRSVYDTLVYRDPVSKQIVPGLAEKVDISGDGLTYTFKLRSGVKFHDGEPLDAAAVAANLDRITDPETKSQKAVFLLGPYDKYVIVDALTIQIVLKTPFTPLLDGLAQVYTGIASPKALKAYDRDRYQLHQVGSGPYEMVEYVPGDYMLLRRNPDYNWGPPFYVTNNAAPIDEIEFRFFTDASTRAPALETDAAQIMGEIAPADAVVLSRNPDIQLHPQPIPGQPLQFFINTTLAPTDNPDFRRILLRATNRIAIVDAVFQQFSPAAFGPLSAITPYYDQRVQTMYPYDADGAKTALRTLGYTDSDNDKFLDKGGEKLHLIMLVPPWGFVPQVAQKIQSQWRELGIDLELKQVANLTALLQAVRENNYHLVAFNDSGVDATVLNNFYRSDALDNLSKVGDSNLDSLLTRATQTLDPNERQNLYSSIQGIIMDQALILPIRDYMNLNGASTAVSGLAFDAYGWFPLLANLSFAPDATTTP